MRKCGDCEHFQQPATGAAWGFCNASPEGEALGSFHKDVWYHTEADDCKMFSQLKEANTDSRQAVWGTDLRYYDEQKTVKADTSVNDEKLKDQKYWG